MPRQTHPARTTIVLVLTVLGAIGCERPARDAQTQTEMNADAASQYRDAEAGLNRVYATIELRLNGDSKQRLIAAERAWLVYREANCSAEKALYEGGSVEPLIESACLAKVTGERTAELQRIYGEQLDLK